MISLPAAIQFAEGGVLSRPLLTAPGARVVLFTFAEGQELTAHTSSRRALVQILSGKCDFQFDKKWHPLEAGAFLQLPPNHLHAVRATSSPCALLLILCDEPGPSPARRKLAAKATRNIS